MSTWFVLLGTIAAALPLSTIAAREVQRRVQPVRLELARRGEEALQRDDLSPMARADIEFMLSTAFGMRWKLLGLLLIMPFVAVAFIFSRSLRQAIAEMGAALRKDADHREITGLHSALMLANNPLLTPVAAVWMAAWLAPAMMIARLLDKGEEDVDGNDVVRYMEQRALSAAA